MKTGWPALEVRQRLETLVQKRDDRPLSAQVLRNLRAVEALEGVGTPEAQALLQILAKGGAGALLTERARQALTRLVRQP